MYMLIQKRVNLRWLKKLKRELLWEKNFDSKDQQTVNFDYFFFSSVYVPFMDLINGTGNIKYATNINWALAKHVLP